MPKLDDYQYLIEKWFEFGLSKVGGMQVVPMEWPDMAAYNRHDELDRWEELQLIKLSKAYVTSLSSGKDRNASAPFCSDPEIEAVQIADKVTAQVQQLIARQKNRR